MAEPIRTAQIMGKMMNGGVEAVVMNYYRNIDRNAVQFDFFVDEDSPIVPRGEIESLGGRVIVIPPYQRLPQYLSQLKRLFAEGGYRIVHSHINTLNVFPLYAAKAAGVPIRIAHNHSTAGKGETKKNILKYALRPFAGIFPTDMAACTQYAGEWLWGKRTFAEGRIKVFYNAIELEKFKRNEETGKRLRSELGLENRFVIGHAGRFCYQKNQEFLVDILAEAVKKEPSAALMLIGSGKTTEDIIKKAERLGIRGNIIFTGNVNNVCDYYSAMDVFALPSRYEGLGIVAVEAQAAGLPVVLSTEVPKDAVVTDSCTYLKLEDGAEKWADTVINAKKPGAGFKIRPEYDIKIQAGELEKYYKKLLGRL